MRSWRWRWWHPALMTGDDRATDQQGSANSIMEMIMQSIEVVVSTISRMMLRVQRNSKALHGGIHVALKCYSVPHGRMRWIWVTSRDKLRQNRIAVLGGNHFGEEEGEGGRGRWWGSPWRWEGRRWGILLLFVCRTEGRGTVGASVLQRERGRCMAVFMSLSLMQLESGKGE